MKFTSTLALSALLAAPALAGPHGHARQQFGSSQNFPGTGNQGFNAPGQGQGQGQAVPQPSIQPSGNGYQTQAVPQAQFTPQPSVASQVAPAVTSAVSTNHKSSSSSSDNYEVNENWAGAVQETSGTATFSYVAATFTLPSVTPTAASSSSDDQAVSFWVGIDGATGQNQIWQAGVDIYVQNGETTFLGWSEWYPADTVGLDMEFSIGDVIVVSVESTSSSEGTALIENLTTGKNVTSTATAPDSSSTLVGQTAEWIVEDLAIDGDGLTFINFGEATFTGCVAKAGGKTIGLDGSSLMAVEDSTSDHVQAVPSVVSDSELKVTYQSS
ncbi:aspergillopepsin [Aspergillus niger]|uniref:A4/G1 family peptidase n=1 Tax=Aspergillus lacticoffeatus (strain CBS 101883) TaxID=1450533 RepID=UPI000D800981|nr:aspergillopepsin [Aspergillus niger CBS 101883]PYH53506.1 aspergillopepsin [Aspergillus niger CBS 101883]GJP92125.1 aspergillopepsin [Aspergillus niger]